MYFSSKKHILSNAILISALVRLLEFIISGVLRLIIRRGTIYDYVADMRVSNVQTILSACTLLVSAAVFIYALRKTERCMSVVPKEDRADMAELQKEIFGADNSKLSAEVIRKLLRIWFSILVGAQLMYDISSGIYTHFMRILNITTMQSGDTTGAGYAFLYNLTHGFKYQGMLIALLLGIVVTAIFLEDKVLRIIAYVIALLFVLSSMYMNMSTFNLMGDIVGIVWSSAIFHGIDTVGLAALAIYMRIHYNGV